MRIALVSDTYTPQVNGVTTVVDRIARVLREFGHAVVVVAPRYPNNGSPPPDELRIPSAAFPPYPAIRLSVPKFGAVARYLDAFEYRAGSNAVRSDPRARRPFQVRQLRQQAVNDFRRRLHGRRPDAS